MSTYALQHGHLTLSTSVPLEILIDNTDAVQYYASITIQNISNHATVYLGDSNVSSTDYGYRLDHGTSFSLERIPRRPHLFAVSSVQDSKIAILRVSM